MAAYSVKGGAYLLAADYLQSESMGNGGLEEAQQIMQMGDTHASLILAHPQGDAQVVGATMGNTAFTLWGAAGVVEGGVGLYNDWQVGKRWRASQAPSFRRCARSGCRMQRSQRMSQ